MRYSVMTTKEENTGSAKALADVLQRVKMIMTAPIGIITTTAPALLATEITTVMATVVPTGKKNTTITAWTGITIMIARVPMDLKIMTAVAVANPDNGY